MFAPHFPYKATMALFGIKRKLVYFARVHAGEYGGSRPVPPSMTAYHISPEAAQDLTAFVNRPEITQVVASAGTGKGVISELTLKPEAAWRRYDANTPNGPRKVSRPSFLRYLEQPCFRMQRFVLSYFLASHLVPRTSYLVPRTSYLMLLAHLSHPFAGLRTSLHRSKSCLCGPCETHGWQNFEDLQACARNLDLYARHLLRKALSHTITPSLLEALKTTPTAMHMIVDYKQKVLPTGHRETQTAAFGKKGKSLHGATCLRWDARLGKFSVLNVRVVCDDSNQTWFHTLAALRTTLDQVIDVWPDIDQSSLQSDGASNYECTAFMHTVKDVFRGVHRPTFFDDDELPALVPMPPPLPAGIRLTRHIVSEVGDGKNLVDQSFQTAQQDMDAARDGGRDLLEAQGILDALETGKALGTINVGMDMGTRALEPKKGPSPLKGIDSLYDREYEYDASGAFSGIRVRQFFGMGTGKLVTKEQLHSLWKAEFDASAVKPALLLPGGGARKVVPNLKLSQENNLEHFEAKRRRANARDGRRLIASFEALSAEARRMSEATTSRCAFTHRGCRHRPFLTLRWAKQHALTCPFRPENAVDAAVARVSVRARAGGAVRLSLSGSGKVGMHGGGRVAVGLSLIAVRPTEQCAVRVALRTHRPLLGPAYGLQPHRAEHELSTRRAQADAIATRPSGVRVLLRVEDGRVHLDLASHRPPPAMLQRGWAIRPPPSTEQYTVERRSFLLELFDWPAGRLNEQQAFEKFKAKFSAEDGVYARSLRLSRAQIKAWFGSEKQRRNKRGAREALADALPDDDGDGDGDGGGGGAAAKQRPPNVAAMRSEMTKLGYAAEAKAAKGAKAVLSALVQARAAPRAVAPAAAATAAPTQRRRPAAAGDSSEEESAADESEEEEEEAEEEYFAVEDVLGMREGPPREFLVRWEGFGPAADTWEPESNLLPSLVREYLESIEEEEEMEEGEEAAEEVAAGEAVEEMEEGEEVAEEVAAGEVAGKRKQPAAPNQKQPAPAPARKRQKAPAVPKSAMQKRQAAPPAEHPAPPPPAKKPRPPPRVRVPS